MDGTRLLGLPKRVLSYSLGFLRNFIRRLPIGLTNRLRVSYMTVATYVGKQGTINPSRFVPRRNDTTGRVETSIVRSSHLSKAEVWGVCEKFFDSRAPKPAIGYGTGLASAIYTAGLKFDADGKPYPEHANIVGWHDEPGRPDHELKHFWKAQAQKIEPAFSFVPRA